MGGCAGFGGPDNDLEIRVGGPGDRVPVEVEITDDGVAQVFGAGVSGGEVVGGPPVPELGVQPGEFLELCSTRSLNSI